MSRRATNTLATLAALAVPLLVTGCKQPVLCAALDSCGGGLPVGDWVLAPGHPSCTEDLYTPAPDPRLVAADLPSARTPIPEPAVYDWCLLLVTGAGDEIVTKSPRFYYESGPIGAATIHYDANRHYVLSTTRTGTYAMNFPAFCMRAFGAKDRPAIAATATSPEVPAMDVCQRLQASLRAKSPPRVKNVTCQADGSGGCACNFDASEREESSGTILPPSDGTMTHIPGNNFPENVSYCVQGDRLQLTGSSGEYLFDRLGLRTLDLERATVNCTNKTRDLGEDGVDCGPACPFLCSAINCSDAMQGPGEDGVDCGANCPKACP